MQDIDREKSVCLFLSLGSNFKENSTRQLLHRMFCLFLDNFTINSSFQSKRINPVLHTVTKIGAKTLSMILASALRIFKVSSRPTAFFHL